MQGSFSVQMFFWFFFSCFSFFFKGVHKGCEKSLRYYNNLVSTKKNKQKKESGGGVQTDNCAPNLNAAFSPHSCCFTADPVRQQKYDQKKK